MSAPARIYQQLSLDDIDPPALASRETVDERALEELAQSIARVGLIQAIGVRRCGARYQVVYGHRRFLACQMIGTPTIECVIVGDGDVSPEALKIIENAEREAVNPAEEAAMLQTLLANDCGGDTDVLARLLHRSREYVESRLLLLAGDRDVLAALRAGKITLSVARELNMMRAAHERRMYLDSAISNGCSYRLARDWRVRANALQDRRDSEPVPPSGDADRPPQPPESPYRCLMCGHDDDPHDMGLYYIHNYCFKAIVRPFLRGLNDEPAAAKV